MVPLEYTYSIGTLVLVIVWVFFYRYRKDTRKEMLFMSWLFAIVFPVLQYLMWVHDWFDPRTITGTIISPEIIILGFSNGGIVSVIYEIIFRKKLVRGTVREKRAGTLAFSILLLVLLGTAILFYSFGITSFVALFSTQIAAGVVVLILRRDLLLNASLGAVLMTLMVLPAYYIMIFLSPEWVNDTYVFDSLSGVLVTGIPIEELLIYFAFGFTVGPFYEYWKGKKLAQA